jgi:lipopolysaccharide export system protein LptC
MNGPGSRADGALQPAVGREIIRRGRVPIRPSGGHPREDSDRYSRRVAFLKRLLPVVGLTLLALVAIWPRLGPLLESVRFALPVIDLREARELRMLNPRYAGLDRYNRPYVITAAVGRQVPNRDDLMSLERPRAELLMRRDALVVMTAATALYQSQAQLLDLFDDVNLVHENGTRFVTKTAHLDIAASTAEGHDPVSGRGPSGDIDAQGFRILEKGNKIIFTGKSDLLLKGSKSSGITAPEPPGLPPEVEDMAARIAVEATGSASATAEPEPAAADPVVQSYGATGPRAVARPTAKLPARNGKAKRDAS